MLELLEPRVRVLQGGFVWCAREDVQCGQQRLNVVHLSCTSSSSLSVEHMIESLSVFIAVDIVATLHRVYCVSPAEFKNSNQSKEKQSQRRTQSNRPRTSCDPPPRTASIVLEGRDGSRARMSVQTSVQMFQRAVNEREAKMTMYASKRTKRQTRSGAGQGEESKTHDHQHIVTKQQARPHTHHWLSTGGSDDFWSAHKQ